VATNPMIAKCHHCGVESQTYSYHGPDLERMQLCKSCYDIYLAKEMVSYWKDHITEEKKRTTPAD